LPLLIVALLVSLNACAPGVAGNTVSPTAAATRAPTATRTASPRVSFTCPTTRQGQQKIFRWLAVVLRGQPADRAT